MAHHAATPTGIRRLVDTANDFRMQMNANVGGVRPKTRIVKPFLSNATAPVHKKPPGQPQSTTGIQGLKKKPCAAAGVFPKKPALTVRGDQNASHIGAVPQLKKSATFILDDRPRSSSLSIIAAVPAPVLPRVIHRNAIDKKRRSASVGASEKKLPTTNKPRALSRIPIPIDRDEQARRRAAIELQSRKREIERITYEGLKEIRVKIYDLKLQERLLIEDRDRQLIALRKELEEGKNTMRPVRLLFDDSNEQATTSKQNQNEDFSRPRPPVARRRSRSLNFPRFEVSSPEDPSLPLFEENIDSPTFHNNQIMLLPKSAAKNPEYIYRACQETWSRVQTPPRSDFQAKNALPMNSLSKRLHEQIHGLYKE